MAIHNFLRILFNTIKNTIETQNSNLFQPTLAEVHNATSTNQPTAEIQFPSGQLATPETMAFLVDEKANDEYYAYFQNGVLYNVKPRNNQISLYEDRQIAYSARYVISDGIQYDLKDAESISKIKIPIYKQKKGIESPTLYLFYILNMRAKSEYRVELTIPLVFKVANLMMSAPFSYQKKDYFRLVIQLWQIGAFEYGDYLLKELEKRLPFMTDDKYIRKNIFKTEIDFCNQFKTDLIEVGYLGCTCANCAPYQNRIYSISGKDKRFPRLPQFIIQDGGLHCGNSIHSRHIWNNPKTDTLTVYMHDKSGKLITKDVNAIKHSNRPFIDDRSVYEKQACERHTELLKKQKQADEEYYSRERWMLEYKKHFEYYEIQKLLKEKAPKSYSGWRRMKKNNTTAFQKILQIASKNSISILLE